MFKNKWTILVCAVAAAVAAGAAAGVISAKNNVPTAQDASGSSSAYESAAEESGNGCETSEPDFFSFLTTSAPAGEGKTAAETTTKKESFLSRITNKEETTSEKASSTTAKTEKSTAAKSTTKAVVPSTSAGKSGKIPNYEYAYAGFEPCYAEISSSSWNLLLVNRNYILPDDYTPTLADAVTDGDSNGQKLDYRVAPHYNQMYAAAKKDGIYLTPVSGYRSVTRQRNNFENKIDYYIDCGYSKAEATQMAAKRILPPGTSEHNAGLAMDIVTADSTAGFQYTKEYRWLEANAADYGFILRYPEDKQDVTEIIYEPWHWRYVGVTAAKAMKASGQCLEEYLGA